MTASVVLLTRTPPSFAFLDDLQAQGFLIQVESNLDSALRFAEEHPPLVIIIDIAPDYLTGICRAFQENNSTQNTPLLVVTTPATAERQFAIEAGATDLLSTPLEEVELLLRLRYHDSNHHSAAQGANQWNGAMDILNHDLKSPLATIVTGMELLRELMADDLSNLAYLVTNALVAAKRQSFLIEDLLAFLLLEEQNLKFHLSSVQVDNVLESLQNGIAPFMKKKGLAVSYQVEENLPQIRVDEILLVRALNALIDNALKFCTAENEIRIEAKRNGHTVTIQIMDNGRPVLSEYNEQILHLTHQSEARRKGSRSTVGVGLPFAQAVLRLMNGDLTVSTIDSWTTFTVTLQLAGE